MFTSSGVNDLNTSRGPLSQDGVLRVFQGDSEGLVVFLQTVVYQVNVPGFHTDSWNETGHRRGSPPRCFMDTELCDRVQQSQTWVKLDEGGGAVSEISARFGRSFLHLHKQDRHQTLSADSLT